MAFVSLEFRHEVGGGWGGRTWAELPWEAGVRWAYGCEGKEYLVFVKKRISKGEVAFSPPVWIHILYCFFNLYSSEYLIVHNS